MGHREPGHRAAEDPAIHGDPATGRDRAAGQARRAWYKAVRPMPPTMKGPCADHEHTFCAGPALIRGEGFADWFSDFR